MELYYAFRTILTERFGRALDERIDRFANGELFSYRLPRLQKGLKRRLSNVREDSTEIVKKKRTASMKQSS